MITFFTFSIYQDFLECYSFQSIKSCFVVLLLLNKTIFIYTL